jgi:uncharacterized protein (TIGR02996 family)
MEEKICHCGLGESDHRYPGPAEHNFVPMEQERSISTEEAFQLALDADPTDANIRVVFADYLDEQGDPRGPGYRALGLHGHRPWKQTIGDYTWHGSLTVSSPAEILPNDWFCELTGKQSLDACWPASFVEGLPRSNVEDAAALAFSRLPATRQAELLAPLGATA